MTTSQPDKETTPEAVVAAAAVQCERLAWRSGEKGAMLYDPAAITRPAPDLFDPASYGDRAVRVPVGGRQSAWFVDGEFGSGVLRQYRRGGMAARISRDGYIWQGEGRSRGFLEYRVLAGLLAAGLNVPRPLAAAYWRRGVMGYRAAIIVQRIDEVKTLAQQLDRPIWDAVADAIVRMHQAGAWHADLNAFNILIDRQDAIWLIDFDRARIGSLSTARREDNLYRLCRSLAKIAGASGVAFGKRVQRAYRERWAAAAGS